MSPAAIWRGLWGTKLSIRACRVCAGSGRGSGSAASPVARWEAVLSCRVLRLCQVLLCSCSALAAPQVGRWDAACHAHPVEARRRKADWLVTPPIPKTSVTQPARRTWRAARASSPPPPVRCRSHCPVLNLSLPPLFPSPKPSTINVVFGCGSGARRRGGDGCSQQYEREEHQEQAWRRAWKRRRVVGAALAARSAGGGGGHVS